MKTNHKRKITKENKKNLKEDLSFFDILKKFLVVRFLMFFCALIITQQESFWLKTSSVPKDVVFVLPGTPNDWGIDDASLTHGAAGDWDYLFDDSASSSGKQIASGNIQTTGQNSLQDDNLPNTKDSIPTLKDDLPINENDIFYEGSGGSYLSGKDSLIDTGLINTGGVITGLQEQICVTPWGERLAEGDFVLAYEQRKDVTNLCNVQRRYCEKGKLAGSYIQKSCKEHTLYSYVKPEPVSYNQAPVNPFIQPVAPSFSGADFDIHGKIDSTTDPIDVWGDPSYGQQINSNSVSQTSPANIQCVTPWGERVKNGQFVKAYKSAVGLVDLPCDVEIRLCVKGRLKGSYTNRTCMFKNITYRDYLVNNYDNTTPSIGDLANSIGAEQTQETYRNSSFWKRLEKYF